MPHARSEDASAAGDGFPVPDYGPYPQRDRRQVEKNYAVASGLLHRDVGGSSIARGAGRRPPHTLVLFTSDNGPATVGAH